MSLEAGTIRRISADHYRPPVSQASLPVLPTLLSTQLRNILALFERQRGGRRLPVLIARQNIDGTEIEFSNMLVEDSNNEQVSASILGPDQTAGKLT